VTLQRELRSVGVGLVHARRWLAVIAVVAVGMWLLSMIGNVGFIADLYAQADLHRGVSSDPVTVGPSAPDRNAMLVLAVVSSGTLYLIAAVAAFGAIVLIDSVRLQQASGSVRES
jgi:hypothetical protein